MQREETSVKFPFGSELPLFDLPNAADNQVISSSNYFAAAQAALVVFTCNHCPYVKGSEDAMLSVINEFSSQGLKAVFISSNDALKYPEDNFAKMQEKTRAWTEKFPRLVLPYLFDESQSVARSFDAACTPECYLFVDGKLAFHGAPNSDPKNTGLKEGQTERTNFLRAALTDVFAKTAIKARYCHPIGCSIKWISTL